MVLQVQGHEVQTAHDGVAALEAARTFLPQVIFTDLGLPKLDGFAVARQLRAELGLEGVMLVALTGYGSEEDRRRAREAGFDLHLVKPADSAVLEEVLVPRKPGPPVAG
jgi:CheY-like chemotaxis protein